MTLPSLATLMFAVCVQAPARIFVLSSALALCWESLYQFISKESGGILNKQTNKQTNKGGMSMEKIGWRLSLSQITNAP